MSTLLTMEKNTLPFSNAFFILYDIMASSKGGGKHGSKNNWIGKV